MKKFLSLIMLTLCTAWQVNAQTAIEGTSLTWELDDNGVLTISGEGDMPTYKSTSLAPWNTTEYKSRITTVVIEDGVTSIGAYAFYKITNIEELVIGAGCKKIAAHAFDGCTHLGIVTWYGTTMTTLDGTAFSSVTGCTLYYTIGAVTTKFSSAKFTKILFAPATELADGLTWEFCDGELTISKSNDVVTAGEMPDYASSDEQPWVDYCYNVVSVSVGEGVTKIGENAFAGFESFETVTLPTTLTTIGAGAFATCPSLAAVNLEGNSTFTANGQVVLADNGKTLVFAYNGFTTIPSTVTTIAEKAFYGFGDRLTQLTLPASVEKINDMAFAECYINTVVAERTESAPVLGTDVFANVEKENSKLKVYVEIKNGHKYESWGDIFGTIESLLEVAYEGKIEDNGTWSFNKDNGTLTVTCNGAMTDYNDFDDTPWANHAASIEKVVVEGACTHIANYAFSGCSNLTNITLNPEVETIGSDAFRTTTTTTTVALCNNTSIDKYAFNSNAILNLTLNGDGSEALLMNENTYSSVTINRTFAAGKSGGIVLPFKPVEVNGLHFYELRDSIKNDGGVDFRELAWNEVQPNVPYIWHNTGTSDITSLTAETTDGKVEIAPVANPVAAEVNFGVWSINGVYEQTRITDSVELDRSWAYIYNANEDPAGKFKNFRNSLTINPYRVYLKGLSFSELSKTSANVSLPVYFNNGSLSVILVGRDGNTTAIEGVEMDGNGELDFSGAREAGVYYDLSGRRVDNPTRGIYILNGKKVLVK